MIFLLLSCLSITTATDTNIDNTTTNTITKTTEEAHIINNVQTNEIKNNKINSDLDTSNSVTTISIGEKNTSPIATTTSNSTENTISTSTSNEIEIIENNTKKSIVKNSVSNVKEATVYYAHTFDQFKNYMVTYGDKEIILDQGVTYTATGTSNSFIQTWVYGNVVIRGNNATIKGNSKSRLFDFEGSNLNISIYDLNFVNFGAEKVNNNNLAGGVFYYSDNVKNETLSLNNCTFINSTARNGGVLSLSLANTQKSYVFINDSKFYNSFSYNNAGVINAANTDIYINNSYFYNSTAYAIAGTIFANSGKLNVTNCVFDDSKSLTTKKYVESYDRSDYSGSALHICTYNEANIINNTFKNSFTTETGVVAFHHNGKAGEGVITIANNTFINNSAAYGAAIGIFKIKQVVIENNSFINNTAFGRNTTESATGGAIYFGSYTDAITIPLKNNLFENNSAAYGGAVYSAIKLDSINNTFINNSALNGGALYVEGGNSVFTGINDTYNNNSAERGGAVYVSSKGKITSTNGTFTENNATYGGVFYIDDDGKFDTNYDVCENNSAVRGGVFYINHTGHAVEAEGSNYTNNKATEYGGVIFLENGDVDSEDETYINNTAQIGGAIYNLNGTLDSINNKLINNSALYGGAAFNSENATLIKKDGTDINNTALIGGAIYNNGTITSTGSSFENNNATTGGAIYNNGNSDISGDTFKYNNATSGGAIYNNATLISNLNTFTENNATNGGAILDNGTLKGTGNNYYNNTALENGGAVYSCEDNIINIQHITFNGNSAGQNGGAIYTENNVEIHSEHDVIYVNNTAENGGAVYLNNGSTLNTSQDQFNNNNATKGGAIFAYANNTVIVKTQTTFDSNNATQGGAIYLSNTTVLNSTTGIYTHGKAEQGSAIYAEKGSTINSNNDKFEYNTAQQGTLYLEENVENNISEDNFTNNTAVNGAAIYTKSDLNTTSTSYADNKAEENGALYIDEAILYSNNDKYTSNKATSGGAIYLGSKSSADVTKSTFTTNDAVDGGAIYLASDSQLNSSDNTFRQNNAVNGGVYYVSEDANLNITGGDRYTTNTATNGGVLYNTGNVASASTEYTKTDAINGGVLYNKDGANFTSTDDKFTYNNATDGAVIYNDGNVTINESTIDSNKGTNSVIINNNQLTLVDNKVSNNYVTANDETVITNTVDTATIVDNVFVNNTDNKRDMLLGGIQPSNITGNSYIDNYLNDTISADELIELKLDAVESYIDVTLTLNNIYNDTVRNGTVYIYDESSKKVGEGVVVDGEAKVRILRSELTQSVTNVNIRYESLSKHYQDVVTKSVIHLGKATVITIAPIETLYVDDKTDVKVSLYEVDGLKPLYDSNITVYINGTKYVGNTTDKGYIIIPDVSFDTYGNYHMNATFEGNSTHESSNVNGTIEVIKIPTHLVLTLPEGVNHPDDEGNINVTIYDSRDNSTIEGIPISLSITYEDLINPQMSDANGNITYKYEAYETGYIDVVASVRESNDKYAVPLEVNGLLFIEKYHTHFHSNVSDIQIYSEVNVTFTLYDESHNLLINKDITITETDENGDIINQLNVRTNENGEYTYTINNIDPNDDITVTAFCTDDYKYRNSTLPVHLVTGKISTWIAVIPENTYVNQTNQFTINFNDVSGKKLSGNVTLKVGNFENVTVEVIDGTLNYMNSDWTWPESLESVPVTVVYQGNDTHIETNATNSFRVFRVPTNTTIEVTQLLEKNTTIEGTVTSEGYPPINKGNVTLTAIWSENGEVKNITLGNVTVINGKYNLTTDKLEYNDINLGRYLIEAVYDRNEVFVDSQADTGTIRIVPFKNTKISIINTNEILVGQDEGIVFTLRDENDEYLINKTLIITINGTDIVDAEYQTDSRGYVVIHTSFDEVGLNNITAYFKGDTYYNESNNTANITIKQKTVTIINVPSPVHVNENITFNVTLKDILGNVLANQTIVVNDHEHQRNFITDENGTVNINVVYTSYGTKTIFADFEGSQFYVDSNATDIIQVLRLDTILNVTATTPVYVENITKIEGYLTLHNETPISNVEVLLYINDEEPVSVTTDADGYYTYDYKTSSLGRNIVKAVFETNDLYWGFDDSAVFIVKPYLTDISVESDRLLKVGNSTDIKGILEDEFGNKLGGKRVTILINGIVNGTTITEDDGSYIYPFTPETDGIYNITVNYTDDAQVKYVGSYDTYQIKVDKIITHINITADTPVNINDKSNVEALLFDEYGNALGREPVKIYVNGTEITSQSLRGDGTLVYLFDANTIGVQNITIKYEGNDKYYDSNNTYQVNVLQIYTHFVELEATNVELGQESTITGYLVDEKGISLKHTKFNVTLNDNESTTKEIETDEDGWFTFTYNSTLLGLNTVTLDYPGSYEYVPTDNYVTFNVDKIDVFITVNDTKLKAGNSTIVVNVTDENGDPIPEGTVIIYYAEDGETPLGNGTVGKNGLVEININTEPGRHDLNIVYNGTDDQYKYSNIIINIDVPKYELNLTINNINNTKVRNSTNITGTLFYENGTEYTPVAGKNLTVYVDGIAVANVTTDADGNYSCEYNATLSGFKNVLVIFEGDENNSYIEANSNFTVEKINTTTVINSIENTTVDSTIVIEGILKDEFDKIIPDVTVTIEINGVNYTNITSLEGRYYYEYTTSVVGENNITVYYNGNNTYNATLNNTKFNVTSHPTNVTANITTPRPGNNLININVTDENKNNVTTGKVVIKENDVEIGSGTIVNGELVTNLDLTPGTHTLTIEYEGIPNYSANNTEISVNIPKYNTTIIPDVVSSTKINDTIIISGTLIDQNNKPIGPTKLNITINNENVTVDVNEDGTFTYTNTTNVTGTTNITITYPGDDNYANSSISYNITVSPLFTQITVNATSPIIITNDTVITGELKDETNKAIEAEIEIWVNGKLNSTVSTDSTGKYSYTLTTDTLGLNNVTVKYAGNSTYTAVNASTNFFVDKMFTAVNVTAVSPIKVGSNTTISGRLVDGRGNPIADAVINITVGTGDKHNVTTNPDGYYSLNVTGETVGEYKVQVFYNGTIVFFESNNTAKFIVEPHDVDINVKVEELKAGNTTVNVTLTDEDGKPIANQEVNITNSSGDVIGTGITNENGTLITNITVEPGKQNITIIYNGTDDYAPENKTIVITVPEHETQLEINDIEDTIVRESTTISGTLKDAEGKPIPNVNVTIKVDGKTYEVPTDSNGNYEFEYNATSAGEKQVLVEFSDKTGKYQDISNTTKFHVGPIDTDVTVNPVENTKVGRNVTINGTLTDKNGKIIPKAELIVSVNGVNHTVTTDDDGRYSLVYVPSTVGTNNVSVIYEGDNNFNNNTEKTTFTVSPVDTTITAEEIRSTKGTSAVEIKVADEDDNNVPYGPVYIEDENGNIVANGTIINGTLTTTLPTQPGENNFKIVFNGTDKLANSSKDITINVPKYNSTIIPDQLPAIKVGEQTNISGTILDENNKPVSGQKVNITINGENHTVTTKPDGTYSLPYTANTSGENNITVTLIGNKDFNTQTVSYKLPVDKLATTTTFTTPTTVKVGSPTTITGELLDQNDKPVSNAQITVKVGNETINTTTDKNGKYIVNTTPKTTGKIPVIVSYDGDKTHKPTNNTGVVLVDKLDTTVTANVNTPVKLGSTEQITGTLLDENNKAISNANITVTVNGKPITTKTNSKGEYNINYPTTTAGVNNVTVTYTGDNEHYPISTNRKFTVEKLDVVVDVAMPNVKAGSSNLVANITDENGNKVSEGTVTITTPDGKQINATVKDGKINVTVPTTPGQQTYKITYNGNENYSPSTKSIKEDVPKVNTTLNVDSLKPSEVDDTTTVKGTLKDSNGNPVPNAEVTVTYADTTKTVKTDSKGQFTADIPGVRAGTNNVTVTYTGNDNYSPASNNTKQTVNKHSTIVTVDEVIGIIGEKITLTAHVTDAKGNKVSGGNLVFKLNGKTLREDYRFDSNVSALKFKVVDGKVTVTITADLYLRNVKNLTASYSGSYKYEANTSDVVTAQIQKRRAIVNVTTIPTTVKQDKNIVFKAYLTDITKDAKNKTSLSTDGTVIFKVNGNTIKDENGSQIHVDVVNNVASYVYYIEPGTASVDKNGNLRNYSVEAVYENPSFYPDTRNSTAYHVEKSSVNINFEKTTVKSNELSLKASFTDYNGNALVGKNTICIKINGKTYQENGKTKYFTVQGGKVNLSGIKLEAGIKVKSVTIVTGERQPYHSARETTTDITH